MAKDRTPSSSQKKAMRSSFAPASTPCGGGRRNIYLKHLKTFNPMKYELGVMDNAWELEAATADIAIATLRLAIQTEAPIAIYTPEDGKSKFAMDVNAEELRQFLSDENNQEAIREAYRTLKNITNQPYEQI